MGQEGLGGSPEVVADTKMEVGCTAAEDRLVAAKQFHNPKMHNFLAKNHST